MEIFIVASGVILTFVLIKFLLKKLYFVLFILATAGIVNYIYKIPYSISLSSIIILIYYIFSIFSEFKYLGLNIFKPCKLYLNGFYEKVVTLLFSLNHILFIGISYTFIIKMCLSMIDITELAFTFGISWIFMWIILHIRDFLFYYIL